MRNLNLDRWSRRSGVVEVAKATDDTVGVFEHRHDRAVPSCPPVQMLNSAVQALNNEIVASPLCCGGSRSCIGISHTRAGAIAWLGDPALRFARAPPAIEANLPETRRVQRGRHHPCY